MAHLGCVRGTRWVNGRADMQCRAWGVWMPTRAGLTRNVISICWYVSWVE